MKIRIFLLIVAAHLCLHLRSEPNLLNGVAVIVNEAIITYKEVFNSMAQDEAFLERRYARQPEVIEQKKRELMEERIQELVERQLILDDFVKKGYPLPESVIDERINRDLRNYGDRLTLTKTLQASGLTYEAYRTKVRERFIIEAMTEHNVPRDPVISPHRIEKHYNENQEKFKVGDQVKLRMIVLTNRPNEISYSPRKLAHEILAKLEEGAPFAEMAKIYSQGSQATAGGDWDWVERSVLREDLAQKAFSMKTGQRSGVIEASDGCYLMLVEESRPSHVKPLSEVREEIEITLKTEEYKRVRKKWIERLKNNAFVRYF